jgi:hypothetical protein
MRKQALPRGIAVFALALAAVRDVAGILIEAVNILSLAYFIAWVHEIILTHQ